MVIWTDHALLQLHQLYDHIAQDSPLYARRVTESLVRKTLALKDLPRLGRKTPELDDDKVRELPLYSYRILYEIKSAHIEILALIHKRQDLVSEAVPRTP